MNDLLRVLSSTLSGAAAGYDAPNAGQAFSTGLRTGQMVSDAFDLPERRREEKAWREEQRNMIRERHQMSKDTHQTNLDYRQYMMNRREADDFAASAQALMGASQNGRSRYLQNFLGQTKAYNMQAQQRGDYPVSQKRIERIDNITKASNTLANLDAVLFLGQQFNTTDNDLVRKRAGMQLKMLESQTGIKFSENDTGDKVIQVNGKFLPFSPESMKFVKEQFHEKIQQEQNMLIQLEQTRYDAKSGALRGIFKETANSTLPFERKNQISQEFVQRIGNDPRMAKAQGLTHIMHRIDKAKEDEDLLGLEVPRLIDIFKDGDVKYTQDEDDMYLDKADLNEYLNRAYPEHKHVTFFEGDGMIKIDKSLIETIRNKSGIPQLRQKYIDQINLEGEWRNQQLENQLQQELGKNHIINEQKVRQDIQNTQIKETAKEEQTLNNYRQGKFGKASYDEVVNMLPEVNGNSQIVDMIESKAMAFKREKSDIKSLEKLWRDEGYSKRFQTKAKSGRKSKTKGMTFEEAYNSDTNDLAKELAEDLLKSSQTMSPKRIDLFKKNLLRKFLSDPKSFEEELKKMQLATPQISQGNSRLNHYFGEAESE